MGDWGLGIGDWGLGPIPNPQSPIPNPQSPIIIFIIKSININLYIYINNKKMSEGNELKGKKDKKTAIEEDALTQEIIKRDHKYFSLNENFHLDLKTRI